MSQESLPSRRRTGQRERGAEFVEGGTLLPPLSLLVGPFEKEAVPNLLGSLRLVLTPPPNTGKKAEATSVKNDSGKR